MATRCKLLQHIPTRNSTSQYKTKHLEASKDDDLSTEKKDCRFKGTTTHLPERARRIKVIHIVCTYMRETKGVGQKRKFVYKGDGVLTKCEYAVLSVKFITRSARLYLSKIN